MKRAFWVAALTIFAAFAAAQGHGGMHFRFAGSDGGSLVQLAQRSDVQKELVVTDEQKTKLSDIEDRMEKDVETSFADMQTKQVEDPNVMRHTIGDVGEKFAKELPSVLNEGQAKRLMEILIQRSGYSSLERADVQEVLGFTADQKSKVDEVDKALLAAFDGLATSGKSRDEMKADAKAAMDAHSEGLKNILTADQATKFDAMKGKPFTFEEEKKGA